MENVLKIYGDIFPKKSQRSYLLRDPKTYTSKKEKYSSEEGPVQCKVSHYELAELDTELEKLL